MVATTERRPDQEYECARGLISDAVLQHINAWATIIGLAPTDACIDQFRDDVTAALHGCIQAHIAGASNDPCKEIRKEVREEFLGRHRERIAAIKKLLEAFAPRWPPSYHEFQAWVDPTAHQHDLQARAEAMRLEADERKDHGGRPSMRAFKALAKGLVFAYRRSTRDSGVGYGARKGKLRAFVESVLPVAGKIAEAVTGRPLVTPKAIGDYLHRVASAK